MENFLYGIVGLIAKAHSYILSLNDSYEYNFSDKYLHFIVIGILGMLLILVVHPIFLWLAKNKHVMAISFVYVFTLIVVITFAIEIGQKVTRNHWGRGLAVSCLSLLAKNHKNIKRIVDALETK